MNHRNFALQIKEAAADGTFSGYCSVFGNTDSDGEVIDPGAFAKCLKDLTTVPILWQHSRVSPCGWASELREDGKGLLVKGRLMIDTEDGRRAYSFLKLGLQLGGKPGLSIGFTVPAGGDYLDKGVRHFREISLKEFSVVTFPANSLAAVTSAKAEGDDVASAAVEKIGSMLDDAHQHFQSATTAHEKGIGSLNQVRDFISNWYASRAHDVNLPNPVGNVNREAEAALLIRETEEFLRRTKNL